MQSDEETDHEGAPEEIKRIQDAVNEFSYLNRNTSSPSSNTAVDKERNPPSRLGQLVKAHHTSVPFSELSNASLSSNDQQQRNTTTWDSTAPQQGSSSSRAVTSLEQTPVRADTSVSLLKSPLVENRPLGNKSSEHVTDSYDSDTEDPLLLEYRKISSEIYDSRGSSIGGGNGRR